MTIFPPVSDSSGLTHDPGGINTDRLAFIKTLKTERRGSLSEYAKKFGVKFYQGERPWGVAADLAFPCVTQNECDQSLRRHVAWVACPGIRTFTCVAESSSL